VNFRKKDLDGLAMVDAAAARAQTKTNWFKDGPTRTGF